MVGKEIKIKEVLAACEGLEFNHNDIHVIAQNIWIVRVGYGIEGKFQYYLDFCAHRYQIDVRNEATVHVVHLLLSLGVQPQKIPVNEEFETDYPKKIGEFPKDLTNAVWMGLDYKRDAGTETTLRQVLNVIYLVLKSYGFDAIEMCAPSPAPDENGLLPCAHCGGKADIQDGEKTFAIRCFRCYVGVQGFIEADIRMKWNTRAHAPIQTPSIDLLKKAFIYGQAVTTPESSDILFDSFIKTINAPIAGKDPSEYVPVSEHRQILGLANHTIELLRSNLNHEKLKSSKLVGAMEEIAEDLDCKEISCNDARYGAFVKANEALAAYREGEAT